MRIVIRYNNIPSDARLFVPNLVAGSNAAVPTAAGDYGGLPTGGNYVAGSNTLLLARVIGTDANGVGGGIGFSSNGSTFDGVSEVQVVNGVGVATFEVVDSNGASVESAQIPTFLGAAAHGFCSQRDYRA